MWEEAAGRRATKESMEPEELQNEKSRANNPREHKEHGSGYEESAKQTPKHSPGVSLRSPFRVR